jgi:hypothetical protein
VEVVDIDLLFQIPQEYARIIGRKGRGRKLKRSNNGGQKCAQET